MRCRWIRRAHALGVLLSVLAMPLAGYAQVESREGIALQNQLYQLRQDLQVLRSDVSRGAGGGGGGGGDVAASLLARVQTMEEQLRQLRGRIDETQNLVTRQNAELSKRIDDLTFQLNLPGRSGALSPPAVPAPPPVREVTPRPAPIPEPARAPDPPPRPEPPPKLAIPAPLPAIIQPPPAPPKSFTFNQTPEPMRETPRPAPRPVEPPPKPVAPVAAPPPDTTRPEPTEISAAVVPPGGKRTPEMALQEGNAALARRDYAGAERAAREVMSNRTSPRAYDGQFLLAQSLAGQKQFAQAAIAYDDAYNRSHKGRHAEDALLGLAGALIAINEKKAACDTLGRMRTEFPQVRVDVRDTITKTNDRAGCGR